MPVSNYEILYLIIFAVFFCILIWVVYVEMSVRIEYMESTKRDLNIIALSVKSLSEKTLTN